LPTVREHLLRHASPGKDGLIFSSERDPSTHLSAATLNGRAAILGSDGNVLRAGFGWREARRQAGREDLGLHDLRHTGASMAGEEGASTAELTYSLGHSTPSMRCGTSTVVLIATVILVGASRPSRARR